ncbi:hypothetical protein Pcinc_027835 [Petrolisthes cinctipes]|uniref:Uncharacterized protein n=1 Tax=Petrolisthes cinctipes TaxID=88211 RepID=A0AAE1K662_PETCI|nr:hypothetical protein Pcinc_027835 [Petrolisthes cinctipes]
MDMNEIIDKPPPALSLVKAAAQGLTEPEDTVSQQLPDTPLLFGQNHSQSSQRKATATSRPYLATQTQIKKGYSATLTRSSANSVPVSTHVAKKIPVTCVRPPSTPSGTRVNQHENERPTCVTARPTTEVCV